MLTIAQVDLFQAQLQTKMLEVAIEQAKAELNDDIDCAKAHQCTYRFLSIYFAVFTNPLFNYTMAQTESMINWISGVASLNEVVPVSFTDFTIINTGTNHTHTISQIIGLQAALDDLQAQIDSIEGTQITDIDGGDARNHDPDVSGTGILITIRNDSTSNWEGKNPTLSIGEMGFTIDNGVVTGIKIGLGSKWKDTPYHFSPFTPIVTSAGRNLDATYGGPPYNAQHNFQTEKEAWDYVLNPYSAPYITFPYPNDILIELEVGDRYDNNGNEDYEYYFNVFNANSVLKENELRMYYPNPPEENVPENIYKEESSVPYELTDQTTNNTILQYHTAPLDVTSITTGKVPIFSAYVRGVQDTDSVNSVYGRTVYAMFKRRTVAFLWRNDDVVDLLNKTKYPDTALTGIVENIRSVRAGTAFPIMGDGAGTKVFTPGTNDLVPFNSDLFNPSDPGAGIPGGTGQFNIVVAAPTELGPPVIYSPNATPSDKFTFIPSPRKFKYTHGTLGTFGGGFSEEFAIDYTIYIVEDVMIGPMSVKII